MSTASAGVDGLAAARPTGFTILAVVFSLIAAGAAMNVALGTLMRDEMAASGVSFPILVAFAVPYAATAAAAALALWRVSSRAATAVGAWAAVTTAFTFAFPVMLMPANLELPMSAPVYLLLMAPFALGPWALWWYVQRRLRQDGVR